MSLSEIAKIVKPNIEEFNTYFDEVMRTKVALLNLVLKYIALRKGKQVRPTLVFLSAGAVGSISKRSHIGAAMIELLHTATLVHDDVVDKAEERRGVASINANWNNKIAVLVGDFLLSKGLLESVENDEFQFLKVTARAVRRMSEGELMAVDKIKSFDISEEEYYQIISDKTASLLSACCEVGAISVTDDKSIHKKLELFGEYLGIAFQIKDDILDYESKSTILGKPVGNDIRERKVTLPLIYAFRNSESGEAKKIFKKMKSGNLSSVEVQSIIDFAEKNGGLDYSRTKAEEYRNLALEQIASFEDTEYKSALLNFADFVISRKK